MAESAAHSEADTGNITAEDSIVPMVNMMMTGMAGVAMARISTGPPGRRLCLPKF